MDENNEQTEEGKEAEESVDWQARAKELEVKAIKQRETTKELKAKLSEFEARPKEEIKPADLDYSQKAYLKASGLQSTDEMALFKEVKKRYKDDVSLDDVLESQDFKVKLENLRTTKANQDASDTGGSGGASVTKNSAEYYLSKGEEPPTDAPREVRQKYVKLRGESETSKKMFYND